MVSMMIEFTSNNHQIEMICFNSFIITRQNDDGGREIISMVPLGVKLTEFGFTPKLFSDGAFLHTGR